MQQPKVMLVILDGWGYSTIKKGNAIALAHTPCFDRLWRYYPHTLLEASAEAVGLPWGEIGGSEVGHLSLGSGRIVHQDLSRVTNAINSGEFYDNEVLIKAVKHAEQNNSALHLLGLVSTGGIHSHFDHINALLEILRRNNFKQPSYIHMFTDGRDTPPKSALLYVEKLESQIKEMGLTTKISTISGRYWAMDRDHHWDRTFATYDCLVNGTGNTACSAEEAIKKAYNRGETDEFIKPTVIIDSKSNPIGLIQDNDSLIFFPFRPERMCQLSETFTLKQYNYLDKKLLNNNYIVTLTEYAKYLPANPAYFPDVIKNPLAEVISKNGMSQLHIAETEKYAHVTYFLNGYRPTKHENEDWVTIPSERKVPTYDKKPEMSAHEITKMILNLVNDKNYDFVVVNFANADMVGHTGKLDATIKAVETIDKQLHKLIKNLPETTFLITADHGNADEMINPDTGEPNTSHTSAPVPFILVGPKYRKDGSCYSCPITSTGLLADVSTTVLHCVGIGVPKEMTGYDFSADLTIKSERSIHGNLDVY